MHLYSFVALQLLASVISALPSGKPNGSPGYLEFPLEKRIFSRQNALATRDNPPVFENSLNNYGVGYYMYATVGTPSQIFKFLVDTGSSDIWVYAPESAQYCSDCTDKYFDYTKSSSFQYLSNYKPFRITYGDHSGVSGYYAYENVGVAGKHINQVIGVAQNVTGHPGQQQGIFGLGLDKGESYYDEYGKYYPGFISSLVNQSVIDSHTYSIYFNSKNADDTATGSIIFGGYDNTKWTGTLQPFPMIEPAPDGAYRLDVKEPTIKVIVYNSVGVVLTPVPVANKDYAVHLDTGTTQTILPESQFAVIANAIGAQIIGSGPYYHVDCGYANQLGGIEYDFDGPNGGVTITVPWSELLAADSTLPAGRCFFGIHALSNSVAKGTYILGDTFIRSTYLLYNFDEMNIYIGQVVYTKQKRSEIRAIRRA